MKITNMPEGFLKELVIQWEKNSPLMPDADRPVDSLYYLLASDSGASQWYVLTPDTDVVFYLRGVIPGVSAVFAALNLGDANASLVKTELREIMREYDLRRLTLTVPAPVVEITRIAQSLGFWPEGRMKDATVYNGEYTDLDILGFYRSEVEDGKISVSGPAAVDVGKVKKRRRRSRRKKKKVAPEGEQET